MLRCLAAANTKGEHYRQDKDVAWGNVAELDANGPLDSSVLPPHFLFNTSLLSPSTPKHIQVNEREGDEKEMDKEKREPVLVSALFLTPLDLGGVKMSPPSILAQRAARLGASHA